MVSLLSSAVWLVIIAFVVVLIAVASNTRGR